MKAKYTEEDLKRAIEMARGIKEGKDRFDIDSIRGLTEICTYDWEEEYSEEEIIQLLQKEKNFIGNS